MIAVRYFTRAILGSVILPSHQLSAITLTFNEVLISIHTNDLTDCSELFLGVLFWS
jgi:hypothetical protein